MSAITHLKHLIFDMLAILIPSLVPLHDYINQSPLEISGASVVNHLTSSVSQFKSMSVSGGSGERKRGLLGSYSPKIAPRVPARPGETQRPAQHRTQGQHHAPIKHAVFISLCENTTVFTFLQSTLIVIASPLTRGLIC